MAALSTLSAKKQNFVIEYTKDFNARRAAEASGYSPDTGYSLRQLPDIDAVVDVVLRERLSLSDIDAEWVLMQAVDNCLIAKQRGEISASNTALTIVAKHTLVDAFAAEKINVSSTSEVIARLKRARDRLQDVDDDPDEEVSFF